MFSSSKSITVKRNFTERFVKNFVYELGKINSDVSISNIERCANAKSSLGLLSLAIKKDNIIRVDIHSGESVEKAQDDLHRVLELIEVI